MLRFAFRSTSVLAVLMTVAALAMAQAQQAQQAQPPAKRGAPDSHAVRAKSIMGAMVSLQGGTRAGTVEDIVLSDEGVVDYLVVSEGGKLVTVPWEAVKFNFEKRTAVINIPVERFREIPTYTVETYPNFYAPTYRTQVYKWYGLTPGQERRLERRLDRK